MRILRYEVPVDDMWHTIPLSGKIYPFVNAPFPHMVEFWALDSDGPTVDRKFRVVGTGQPVPFLEAETFYYIGTAVFVHDLPFSRLVWHLFESV